MTFAQYLALTIVVIVWALVIIALIEMHTNNKVKKRLAAEQDALRVQAELRKFAENNRRIRERS